MEASRATQISPARWWTKETVAVVTGGNKGIGFEIVRQLAEEGLTVVLTSRDVCRGQAAVKSLRSIGCTGILYHSLDVADPSSIRDFVSWLKTSLGGLDILVNNAAVSFNDIDENSVEHAETVIATNFSGPKLLTESVLPLFRPPASSARILNISSRLGLPNKLRNPALKRLLEDEERLSEVGIEEMVRTFLSHVKQGTWEEEGWPKVWTDYSVSKLALNAYSVLLARRLKDRGVGVNCFCPGYTITSMTKGRGVHTAAAAARSAVRIVLLPPDGHPTGKFFIKDQPHHYCKL
ncbi:(+)-neomenthol dehydrogenase [Nymphaea colorata]|nr:(+)-neomenthol dehydrogenase [Nymphaea colorata]